MKDTPVARILITCLLLTGCKVGPDYHTPKTAVPNAWHEAKPQPASTLDKKALAEAQWWESFHDPVLDTLIAKGLAQNFDLAIANTRINEARAALSFAKADLLPEGNMMGSGIREANTFALGTASFPKPFNIFQTGFDASWETDIFGGKRRALESSIALFGATKATRDDIRISILAEIARNYMNVRRYQAQIAIADSLVKTEQKNLKIKQELFASGNTAETDAIHAQTLMIQAESQRLHYQDQLTATEYALDLLLGEQPGTTHIIVADTKPVPVADKNIIMAAPAEVIANRPDIRIAERKFASSVSEIGVAKARLFPEISLSGFFGFLSTDTGSLINPGSKSWSAGGNLLWPVLNYSRLSSGINIAKAQEKEALIAYKKSVISALTDVETTLSAYNKQEEDRTLMEKMVAVNAHALDLATMRYKAGVSSLVEVLDAEKTLYTAKSQETDATASSAQNFIAVYKSLGGGWKTPPIPTKPPVK